MNQDQVIKRIGGKNWQAFQQWMIGKPVQVCRNILIFSKIDVEKFLREKVYK